MTTTKKMKQENLCSRKSVSHPPHLFSITSTTKSKDYMCRSSWSSVSHTYRSDWLEVRDRERGSRNGSRCEEESVMLELLGDGREYIQTYFSFLNLFITALADRSWAFGIFNHVFASVFVVIPSCINFWAFFLVWYNVMHCMLQCTFTTKQQGSIPYFFGWDLRLKPSKQESWNPGEMEWMNPVNGCFGFGTGMWWQSSFIKDLRSLPSTYLRRSWRSAARRSLNPSTSSNLEIAAALHFAQTFCLWRV